MREALIISGCTVAAVGVALLSIPAGLIVAGLLLGAIAFLSE